jgi:hypothetical protein
VSFAFLISTALLVSSLRGDGLTAEEYALSKEVNEIVEERCFREFKAISEA